VTPSLFLCLDIEVCEYEDDQRENRENRHRQVCVRSHVANVAQTRSPVK
jgi:hypothetical protein